MTLRLAVVAAVLTCGLLSCACTSGNGASPASLPKASDGVAAARHPTSLVAVDARPWLDAHKASTVRTCLGSRCADLRYHRLQLVKFRLPRAGSNIHVFRVEVRLRTPGAAETVRVIRLNAHPTTRIRPCKLPIVFADLVGINSRGHVSTEYSPQNCTSPQ